MAKPPRLIVEQPRSPVMAITLGIVVALALLGAFLMNQNEKAAEKNLPAVQTDTSK